MGTDESLVSLFADDPTLAVTAANLMPVDMVEPSHVREAVAWLAFDRGALRHWPGGSRRRRQHQVATRSSQVDREFRCPHVRGDVSR